MTVKSQELVFKSGDLGTNMYFVIKGEVAIILEPRKTN